MSLYLKAGRIKNQLLTWDIWKTNAINAVMEMALKILELATGARADDFRVLKSRNHCKI